MPEMCIIQGCDGTEDLLSFPQDPSTLQQWLLCLDGRLKHPVNSSSKVCSAHFTSDSLAYWKQQKSEPKEKSSDRKTFMLDVVVKFGCLLQLFRKCLACCSDTCSVTTSRKGPVLHVTQCCISCHASRVWASHPPDDLPTDSTAYQDALPELLLPPLENTDIDMREEVDEQEEEEETEEEEEQDGKQNPKHKRNNSDDEWAPSFEEVAETSGEESESSEEEEEGPYPLAWCHDCAEEAGAHCFKQKHLQLYCCVQCGYRDGYQESKNTDSQETQRIGSPEAPNAGHQEGTGDVSHLAERSWSPEADSKNKATASSDCPEDPNSISSQGDINLDTSDRNRHGNQTAVSNAVEELSCDGDGDRACGIREQSSVGNHHQGVTRTGIQEDASGSYKDSNNSQLGFTSGHHKEGSAVNQEKINIPIYAVYFRDVNSLQNHIEESHGHKRELCPDCGKFLYRHKGKSSHICNHKDKPFSCLMCGKYFASKAGFNLHNRVHTEDYMLSCRYCYKAFRFLEDKRQHEETHQGEEFKYCCSDCPKQFADHVSRNDHRKTHWEHGRFICKICDKTFTTSDHLQRHEMVHTGLKPYICKVCDRSFNQPGHLKAHIRVHTGEKPYKCQDCGLCFNHNVSLKNHVQRKHRSACDGDNEYREEV